MSIFGVRRAGSDRRLCLTNEIGKLFDEQNSWQISRRYYEWRRRSEKGGAEATGDSLRPRLWRTF